MLSTVGGFSIFTGYGNVLVVDEGRDGVFPFKGVALSLVVFTTDGGDSIVWWDGGIFVATDGLFGVIPFICLEYCY